MKSLFLSFIMLAVFAATALAAPPVNSITMFNKYTGLSATARYSKVYNVTGYNVKTVQFQGYTSVNTEGSLRGTAGLECSTVGSSGPFVACKDKGSNAATTTANAVFVLEDTVKYVRAVWTRTKNKVSAWLTYK